MKKEPISVSQIFVSLKECEEKDIQAYQPVNFDYRHDFVLPLSTFTLSVFVLFVNERQIQGTNLHGVRRKVNLSLVDITARKTVASKVTGVNLSRIDYIGQCYDTMQVEVGQIDCDHTYKMDVSDFKTGVSLGHHSVRFFHPIQSGLDVKQWFEPLYAGVEPDSSTSLHRGFKGEEFGYCYVKFCLHDNFEPRPKFLPEMEVRIHYPDGEVETRFVKPVEGFDYSYSYGETLNVSAPFIMTNNKRGMCYCELRCLGHPVTGFVFATDSDFVRSPWRKEELECMDEYSPDAAARRFAELLRENDKDERKSTEENDEDVFEQLLNEFIDTQMESETPEEENAAENAAEEDAEEDAEENNTEESEPQKDEKREESIMKSLSSLTGLKSVKEKLATYEKVVMFNKLRAQSGLSESPLPLHAMFLGSPGTGKTTVAKRMGFMLKRAGVLSRGHVVVRERATLLGQYYSNEETNTLKAIEEAQGGILLIDEAYQLYQPDDPRDPGKFVIESLMTALADTSKRDWMLVLAGYPDEMRRMFDMNPGLKSRIPESNIYVFDDFTEPELMEIAVNYLTRNHYTLTDEAHEALSQRLANDYAARDKTFGNARHVLNVIQTEILPAMAVRVMEEGGRDTASLTEIRPSDIPLAKNLSRPKHTRIGFCA